MKICCHSNLDLRSEQWPTDLDFRPMIGDLIRSATQRRKDGVRLELQVVKVTIVPPSESEKRKYESDYTIRNAPTVYLDVELHLPPHRFENILKFQEWYETL